MIHRMYMESRMLENSEPSGGNSSYFTAMSIIRAALLVTLIFHSTYESTDIGEPIYRNSAKVVSHAWLLSHGACTIRPMMGKTHVVMVFAASFL